MRFEVKDENGLPVTAVNISLLQLQGQRADTKMNTANEKFQRHCSLEVDLPFVVRYRLNILFLFTLIGMLFIPILSSFHVSLSILRLVKVLGKYYATMLILVPNLPILQFNLVNFIIYLFVDFVKLRIKVNTINLHHYSFKKINLNHYHCAKHVT